MLALLIIALLIGIAALALGIALTINYKSMKSEKEKIDNAIGFMKADISANRKSIAALEMERDSEHGLIDQITYDLDKDTVNISANLSVTGWVCAEDKKEG